MATAPQYPPQYALRRVSRREPCPICEHDTGCEIRADGAVNCIRFDSPHPSNRLGGHWHRLPARGDHGRVHHDATTFAPRPETPPAAEPWKADDATLDAISRAILAHCPLADDHQVMLRDKRHLPVVTWGLYGTLPARGDQGPLMAHLLAQFDRATLLGFPGIVPDARAPEGLRLNTRGRALLLAVVDVAGHIVAFHVRPDDGTLKTFALSSAKAGGPGPGVPPHVARPHVVTDWRVRVVEGQFNATITAHLTGAVAVGISGHVNYPAARPTLEALQAEGHDVLMIALDADDPAAKATTVRQVEASRQALAAAACALGYAVRFARWEHAAGKGMDDLLLAGGAYAIEPYHPALAEQQPVPADDDQQEPPPVDETAAGYQWSVIRTLIRNPAKVTLRNKQKGTRTVHHLTPTDMAVYMAAMVRYSLYPDRGATERPANPPMQRINVGFLASDAGVTPNSVSASLKRLHALGLLTITPHDVYHDDIQSWRTVLLAGKGRELGWNEQLPTDERRAADSARKRRCPHCHGARLVEHTLQCKDCLKTCTVAEAEQAATDAARAEAGDAAGQNAPHMDTPVDNRDPSTESVEPPDDDEDLAAALAAMVRQTADPEALAAHVDALRGDPRWAELSEVARRRVLRAAEHWREHLERTVAAPTVAPPPDHSVGGSTNSVTVPLEAEEHASLCMENVEPSAQPLPDHSAGGSPESVQACAPAPPGELSPTAAALIAHLQAVRYPDALAREWHWLSGPGGRRYQDLPPEERAAVAAAYQACATRWEARAS